MAPIGRLFEGPAPLLAAVRFCTLPMAAPIGRAFAFGLALIRLGSLCLAAEIEWVMHGGSTGWLIPRSKAKMLAQSIGNATRVQIDPR